MSWQGRVLTGCIAVQFILYTTVCSTRAEEQAEGGPSGSRAHEFPLYWPCPTQTPGANITRQVPTWSPTGVDLVLGGAAVGGLFEGKTDVYCWYTPNSNITLRRFVVPGSCLVAADKKGFYCKSGTTVNNNGVMP
jgi:hypothetical protein